MPLPLPAPVAAVIIPPATENRHFCPKMTDFTFSRE